MHLELRIEEEKKWREKKAHKRSGKMKMEILASCERTSAYT